MTDPPLDPMEAKKRLDCSHIFHEECIGEWLNRQHTCPLCRAAVPIAEGEQAAEAILNEGLNALRGEMPILLS